MTERLMQERIERLESQIWRLLFLDALIVVAIVSIVVWIKSIAG